MPDRFFSLNDMSPKKALQLCATFARTQGVAQRQLLAGTLCDVREVGPVVHVDLYVRDRGGEKGNTWWTAAFETLRTEYTNEMKKGHIIASPPSIARPLANKLPALLEKERSGLETDIVRPLEKERLIVAPPDVELLAELRFHTTSLRAAAVRIDGEARVLYHVVDDRERLSSFQSLIDADALHGAPVLSGYQVVVEGTERLIFMSGKAHVDRGALVHFCELIEHAPELFNAPPTRGGGPVEALIFGDKPKVRKLVLTRHVAWRTEQQLSARYAEPAQADVIVTDQVPEVLTRLEEQLRSLEGHGYQLEMTRSRYQEWNEAQYERLQLQQAEIIEGLAELESFAILRPLLLRYTQRDLPVLADTLRSYAVPDLKRLKYAFQATGDRFSDGVHYIFVEPGIVMSDLDPLVYWDGMAEQPLRFWLDPHWAHHYFEGGDQALVFTPRGRTLRPPLHSWGAKDMDSYLRDVLGPRYHGKYGVAKLPERPLYVFDGEPGRGENIYLTVLDRAAFQPLDVKLGWLNDNLYALDALGIEPFITGIARDASRRQLAEQFADEADRAAAHFNHLAQELSDRIAGHTGELTDHISGALHVLTEKAEAFTNKAHELDVQIKEIEALYEEMSALARRAQGLAAEAEKKAVEELDAFSETQTVRVERKIEQAEATRASLEVRADGTVATLNDTRARLRDKLNELRRR